MNIKTFITGFLFLLTINIKLYAENVSLCYHQFDYSLTNLYSVLPEVFEWQVNTIRQNGIPIITLDQMIDTFYNKDNIGTNVLITIDDGWKNELNIIPIAQKYKVPVTIFLVPQFIDNKTNYFTSDDIEFLKKIPEVSFGCHSYSHPVLVHKNAFFLNKEVAESRYILEKMLNRKIDTFAYPYGAFDDDAKKLAGEHYKLAFGINSGPNGISRDKSNINRDVIYKMTSFGEFISAIDYAMGRHVDKGYNITSLGEGNNNYRHFHYIKIKLFKFPAGRREKSLLIIPSSSIGPGWAYKIIDRLTNTDIETDVAVERNNNIPFYRPDKEMRSITNWGLSAYMDDIKRALDYLSARKKKIILLTWGNGFDLIAATLLKYPAYLARIKGMITVNPSVRVRNNDKTTFLINSLYYENLLRERSYSLTTLSFFMKIKTLYDLAVLKPASISPYAKTLGYPVMSNFETFKKAVDEENDPDLSLDSLNTHYTIKEFMDASMKPLPIFSMLEPLCLLKDFQSLWYNQFSWKEMGINSPAHLRFPVTFINSEQYAPCIERIQETFPHLKKGNTYYFEGVSTIEMLLSTSIADLITNETIGMME